MGETIGDGRRRGDREWSDENWKICLSLGAVVLAQFLRLPLQQFNNSSKESQGEHACTKILDSWRKGREENFKTRKRRVGVSPHETPSHTDDEKDCNAQYKLRFARLDREGKEE